MARSNRNSWRNSRSNRGSLIVSPAEPVERTSTELIDPEKQTIETDEKGDFADDRTIDQGGDIESPGELRLTPDGHTILVPQPSDDPEDPLNWSWAKKHKVFAALIPGCLLSDWALTWGSTVFQLQAHEWHTSLQHVSNSLSAGIIMHGPAGLLTVPMCQRYGRLPVLFWSQLLSLVMTIGCVYAKTWSQFTACRALQGLFGAPPLVIALSIIHDMFFFHERTRKINIWQATSLTGPYFGPMISSLCLLKLDWRPDFGVLCGFYGWSFLMVVFLGEETLYDRNVVPRPEPRPKTLLHRLALLTGVEGYRLASLRDRPALSTVVKHQMSILTRPYFFLPVICFIMPITMWTIGLVSTITEFMLAPVRAGGYGFSYVDMAMLYWAPVIGLMLAMAWGNWFNDWLAKRYMRSHGGKHKPENRLLGVYMPVVLGVAGLVLFGESLQHHLSWVGVAFGWSLNTFAVLSASTAQAAYVLDVFPHHASLASAWIAFWRVIGGFSVVYFQLDWVKRSGPAVSFGCQGVVMAAAAVAIIVTQVWGPGWRKRFPAPVKEN